MKNNKKSIALESVVKMKKNYIFALELVGVA
jgi:hypothetical protein